MNPTNADYEKRARKVRDEMLHAMENPKLPPRGGNEAGPQSTNEPTKNPAIGYGSRSPKLPKKTGY